MPQHPMAHRGELESTSRFSVEGFLKSEIKG